jgi:hypothetical protein
MWLSHKIWKCTYVQTLKQSGLRKKKFLNLSRAISEAKDRPSVSETWPVLTERQLGRRCVCVCVCVWEAIVIIVKAEKFCVLVYMRLN